MKLLEKEINSRKFILVENSIIEEEVEAIVNPANETLSHGGGVAGLISRYGGPEIQEESDRKAPVPTGHATYTSAGDLPFKYIIHAVGPVWREGKENENVLLRSAVLSALQLAGELNLKSVSLPCISTGIFGYPLKPALKVIIETILTFMEMDTGLRKIHLCEFSRNKAMEIKEILQTNFSGQFN
jgi:putative ATPase